MPTRRRQAIILAVLLLAALPVGLLWSLRAGTRMSDEEADTLEAHLTAAVERLEARTTGAAQRLEGVQPLGSPDERTLVRFPNRAHVDLAKALGVGRVRDEAQVERLVEEGALVPLPDTTQWWVVQDLDYSTGFVTPDVVVLLERIGRRFHERLREEELPLYRFVISSVLRTATTQAALRRVNPNAAGGASSHEFGTTLDIVYHKFRWLPQEERAGLPADESFAAGMVEPLRRYAFHALGMLHAKRLRGILGRVLVEVQEEGTALVRLERQQPVFHITVAKADLRRTAPSGDSAEPAARGTAPAAPE